MTDTYPIRAIPADSPTVRLDLAKLRASITKLKVGNGFVIPVAELKNAAGEFKSTSIGQRVNALARSMSIRVSTKKVPEGLRVRRES